MALIIPGASTTGTGTPITLANDDDLFVANGIVVGSTDTDAVNSVGDNHIVKVFGTIVGRANALRLLGGTDHEVHIGASGSVVGFLLESSYSGIWIENANTIRNAGLISSGNGIAQTGIGDQAIINTGTIESGTGGGIFVATSGGTTTLKNSGLISGYTNAYESGKIGNIQIDSITNSGKMIGTVLLGGGDDLYDGRKGQIEGTVFGGEGNDKLYGGSEANRLEGGDGNDLLAGGAGNDTLLGNGANDTFLFDTKLGSGNVDTILGYTNKKSNNDTIHLDDIVFAGLSLGGLASKAFKDLSVKGAKVDPNDRIVYDLKQGDLLFDRDGSGKKYAAIQFAEIDNHVKLGAADFLVV